jgi:flagellar biosynthesis protein FliR
MLVLFRVSGIFIAAPIISSIAIPMRFKALLAAMFACAIYPIVAKEVSVVPETDVLGIVPLVLGELVIGFIIGSIAALPLLALELAGVLAGTTMGLGLARIYSPETDTDSDLLGQMLFYIAMSIFIAAGGMNMLFRGVCEGFNHVPLGVFVRAENPLEVFVQVLTSGFELALRVAAPVVAIVFMLITLFGVLSKTIPQLNVMSVGFALQSLAGIAILAWGIYAISEPIMHGIESGTAAAVDWLPDAIIVR